MICINMEDKKETIQKILDCKWKAFKKVTPIINDYLEKGEITDGYSIHDILKIMQECLSLIFGELNHPDGKLNRYKPKYYLEEDFIDMIIDSIGNSPLDRNDEEKVSLYVEDFRSIMWGYINYNREKYIRAYKSTSNVKDCEDLPIHDLLDAYKECMTTVMIECMLRDYEEGINNDQQGNN